MIEQIYRDEWILVVNKPAGLPSQRTRRGEPGAYEELLTHHEYVGLHHRLDRGASGLMVFALSRQANRSLADGFRRHTTRRAYKAVLCGRPSCLVWAWPVDGKPALTHAVEHGHRAGLTAIEATLETGRKHQIRVHAAMSGAPVMGDSRYGMDGAARWPGLALHAHTLQMNHPFTGTPHTWVAPTPPELQRLWNRAVDPPLVNRPKPR